MTFDTANWHNEKIIDPGEVSGVAQRLRNEGKRLVTTNGSFDLLHVGHLDQLEEAKALGDVLFVGVNSDRAVSAAKGPGRPLFPEQARAALLAALACVDYVVIMDGSYSEEPMHSLLEPVRPHVHVNGPDYGKPEAWAEWTVMQRCGTTGHAIRRRNAFSSSELMARICREGAG